MPKPDVARSVLRLWKRSCTGSWLDRKRSRIGKAIPFPAAVQPDRAAVYLFHPALQHRLPLNPRLRAGPSRSGLQHGGQFHHQHQLAEYGGESTLSYFSQMVAWFFITSFQRRGSGRPRPGPRLARHSANDRHFWVDLIRGNLYLLLPAACCWPLLSLRAWSEFKAYDTVRLTESRTIIAPQRTAASGGQGGPGNPVPEEQQRTQQTCPRGRLLPVAIKMLGINGRFFQCQCAHPYETRPPYPIFSDAGHLAHPSGLTYYLGRMVKNQKHGWAVWSAMTILFLSAF